MAATLLPGVKKFLIGYCVLALILFILTIVDMALTEWYDYCFWKFGLVSASLLPHSEGASDESTINGVKDDICSGSDSNYDGLCPDVCDNLSHFRDGGAVMVFFGVLTLLGLLGTGALHGLALMGRPWKNKLFWLWINAPLITWLLGTIIDGAVSNIASIDKTHSPAKNAKVEGGVGLCIVLVIAFVAKSGLAIVFTRKAFLE